MTRPRLLLPAALMATALALAGWATPARADHIATYTLTSAAGLAPPDPSSGPQVVLEVDPMGAVVAPVVNGITETPLQILPNGSDGFEFSNLVVGLKNTTNPPEQLVGLTFGNSGLAPGGVLNFGLNISDSVIGSPTLTSLTPGITVVPLSVNTPEPLSLVLWSTLAGACLWRARRVGWHRR